MHIAKGTGRATAFTAAIVVLAGCAAVTKPAASAGEEGFSFEHIHELVVDEKDASLIVATHEGLYRLNVGEEGVSDTTGPIGGLDFDPMGFTVADGIAYASGHPGRNTPNSFGNPNLGLIASSDRGESWRNVSLTGQTDFHALTVSAGVEDTKVFGLDSSRGLLRRSIDAGTTWTDGAALAARDIASLDNRLYATTAEGLVVSDDDGTSFSVVAGAPPLYLLATTANGGLAGVDTSGAVWTRETDSAWVVGGKITGTPAAMAFNGERIFVADDRGISFTDDKGGTWTVLSPA